MTEHHAAPLSTTRSWLRRGPKPAAPFKAGGIYRPPMRRRISGWSRTTRARCRKPCAPTYASFASSILRRGRYVVDQPRGAQIDCTHYPGRPVDRAEQRRQRLGIADRHVVDAKAFGLELEASGAGGGVAAFAAGQGSCHLAQDLVEDRRRLSLGGGEIEIARGEREPV